MLSVTNKPIVLSFIMLSVANKPIVLSAILLSVVMLYAVCQISWRLFCWNIGDEEKSFYKLLLVRMFE
jgi:uncharacterized membrane protein YdbT with pleckstrin-like domain